MADLTAQPGQTIEVDFDVVNTGAFEDTQDIFLVSENGEPVNVDSITNVTLESGEDTSDTLFWEDVEEGEYTLCVQSDDTVDCISVNVSDIPDGFVYRWDHDEGQGDTTTDSVEGLTVEFNNIDWVEDSDHVGGWSIDLNESNEGDILAPLESGKQITAEFSFVVNSTDLDRRNIVNRGGSFEGTTIYEIRTFSDGTIEAHAGGELQNEITVGQKHVCHVTHPGDNNGDVDYYIDGSFVLSEDVQGTVGNSDTEDTIGWGANVDDGGPADAEVGHLFEFDSILSDSEISKRVSEMPFIND